MEELYKTFTGNKDIPLDEKGNSKIKSFGDINLKDFNSSPNCTDEDHHKQYFKKNYNIDYNNFPNIDYVHDFSWYIGNYPTLEKKKIDGLLSVLNRI